MLRALILLTCKCHNIIKDSFNENIKELDYLLISYWDWNVLHFPHSALSTLRIFHRTHHKALIAWANRFARIFLCVRAPVVSEGENIIFRDNNWYRDSAHWSQNEDTFATFSLWLEWARKREKQRKMRLGTSAVTIRFTEQSLVILLSVFRFGFDAQFHRLCYKTIGSCFLLCTIELWSTWEVWRALKKLELNQLLTVTSNLINVSELLAFEVRSIQAAKCKSSSCPG